MKGTVRFGLRRFDINRFENGSGFVTVSGFVFRFPAGFRYPASSPGPVFWLSGTRHPVRWRQNPWLAETMVIGENSWSSFFRNIVLSPVRRPMGFRSSRRYHPNQKNEIYNLGMVQNLQIIKKVDFLMIYIIFFEICFCIFFWNWLGIKIQCNLGQERSGEAEIGSKWSDGLSKRFGMGFGQQFIENALKIPCFFLMIFPGFPG